MKDKGLTQRSEKCLTKNIDGDTINNVEKDYYKTLIKNRSKTIKIKDLKIMAKKHTKVRMVQRYYSAFVYYAKKPTKGEKQK